MAKTKVLNKKLRAPPKAKARRRAAVPVEDRLDEHAAVAAGMLHDPCGAQLGQTVYPGDTGYISRFNQTFSLGNGAGETAFAIIFKPGNNVMQSVGVATDLTAFNVTFVDTLAPGAGFLNSVASKARCAGACVDLRPLSSPNNATGILRFGVIPASTLVQGDPVTVATINRALTESIVASQALMQPFTVKWSPGTFDDRYSPVTGITSDDDSDRNLIVITGTGFPAATGANATVTAIYEWTPNSNTNGAVIDSTNVKSSKCDLACVLRNLKRKDALWWWSLGKKALAGSGRVLMGYYAGGVVGASQQLGAMLR